MTRRADHGRTGALQGVLVDWAFCRPGRRDPRGLSYDDAVEAARRGDDFVWFGLFEPTPPQLTLLGAEFDLHPLALEDAAKAHLIESDMLQPGGMNFDNTPELRTRYGYFVVLGVMALTAGTLFTVFKLKRWL